MKAKTIQLEEDLHSYSSVERWLNYVYSHGIRSTSTEKTYLHFLRRFCVFTGKTPDELIEERKEHMKSDDATVNSQHELLLQNWRDSMEQDSRRPLARGSVVTAHNIIKSFYLAQGSKLLELVAKSPKSWKTRESSNVVPSPQEFAKIMKKAKNLRDQTYIICMAQTGISLEDFTELIFYGNIKRELEQGIEPLHVPMKRQKIGEHKYDTFLGEDSLSYLKRYLKDSHFKDQEPIFSLSPRAIEYVVKRTSIRAGLKPHITPHRLRAFFSTYLGLSFHTQDTKHLLMVEHWMGHKLPYAGTYMVPPVDIQRSMYKKHEYAISINPNGINFEEE
jgi:integrase